MLLLFCIRSAGMPFDELASQLLTDILDCVSTRISDRKLLKSKVSCVGAVLIVTRRESFHRVRMEMDMEIDMDRQMTSDI